MFHMLSSFDLASEVSIDEFIESNSDFIEHMKEEGLVYSSGPVGRRNRHPIMDTDKARDQEFFYIVSFLDENQCNRAVEYIQNRDEPGDAIHDAVSSKIENCYFICWEDLQTPGLRLNKNR